MIPGKRKTPRIAGSFQNLRPGATYLTPTYYPQGESNPCPLAENQISWATRRWGRLRTTGDYASGRNSSRRGKCVGIGDSVDSQFGPTSAGVQRHLQFPHHLTLARRQAVVMQALAIEVTGPNPDPPGR
jgi:hypothetical protein